jgi:hypothetical protein
MRIFIETPIFAAARMMAGIVFRLFKTIRKRLGELAQLARALAWHARGRRFDSDILHKF